MTLWSSRNNALHYLAIRQSPISTETTVAPACTHRVIWPIRPAFNNKCHNYTDCSTAKTVSHWLFTVETWVQPEGEFCGGRSGSETRLCLSSSDFFFKLSFLQRFILIHLSFGGWHNGFFGGRSATNTLSHSATRIEKHLHIPTTVPVRT